MARDRAARPALAPAPALPPPGSTDLVAGDAGYPAQLRRLDRPPRVLWVAGRAPAAGDRAVAIVGSRAASGAGCAWAHALALALGAGGRTVVSGGAFGVDAAAHTGALDAGAATFAVLGCGVDVVYPDRHDRLFARIAASGGLLSELPPGSPPRSRHFPARNRIIAALAEAVVVVEAQVRSGALITARHAAALGVPVLARPGSPGTDALVRTGRAVPVQGTGDVLAVLGGGVPADPGDAAAVRDAPSADVAALLAALEAGAGTVVGIARRLALGVPRVMALLGQAEVEGRVARTGPASYEVRRVA